jgi:phosphate transport system substrate-binding protein
MRGNIKMKNTTHLQTRSILLSLVLALLVAGCGGAAGSNPDQTGKGGTITVSGAWALYPLMIRWGEEYQKANPDVQIDISAGGAGKGMADALAGAVDIGMVSRQIYPEEIERGAFWVSVTRDAVFPTINANNPALATILETGITQDILVGIFITAEITTWGQVTGDPKNNEPIHVYTRSDACGAAATWAEYLGGVQEDLKGVGVYGDPGLLEAVIKDPFGIGYNNLNYIFDIESGEYLEGVRIPPIDVNGNLLADPAELYNNKLEARQAVATGDYPAPPARDLNLVTNGKPSGLVQEFITWILKDGQVFVEEAGYVELSEAQLTLELNKIEE